MRVLLINKFYYLSGGAERYVFEWEKLLRSRGHNVMIFSMRHPRNRPCAQERFFADQVRFSGALGLRERVRAAAHSIWSTDARRKLNDLLDAEGAPDIAHLHSFVYQLTPAILEPLRARGIPIVQTCHEYAHVCVNQRLYNQRTNEICESCLRYGLLAPLWQRCVKGSLPASVAGCIAGVADALFGRSAARIQRFLTPSAFMRRKMIEGGLPAQHIAHVPNFTDPRRVSPSDCAGDYMLFLGRLVAHKGIMTLLDAARRLPDVPLKVVGDGPLLDSVRSRVLEDRLRNVELAGFLEGSALWDAVRHARAVVIPSEWYENGPLTILEAMAATRAVIASRIAGIPEMVEHGRDGLLFPPGDADALASALEELWRNPDRAVQMGRRGREKVESRYNPRVHYRRMMRHFEEVAG